MKKFGIVAFNLETKTYHPVILSQNVSPREDTSGFGECYESESHHLAGFQTMLEAVAHLKSQSYTDDQIVSDHVYPAIGCKTSTPRIERQFSQNIDVTTEHLKSTMIAAEDVEEALVGKSYTLGLVAYIRETSKYLPVSFGTITFGKDKYKFMSHRVNNPIFDTLQDAQDACSKMGLLNHEILKSHVLVFENSLHQDAGICIDVKPFGEAQPLSRDHMFNQCVFDIVDTEPMFMTPGEVNLLPPVQRVAAAPIIVFDM
jgi:hypothetical protein